MQFNIYVCIYIYVRVYICISIHIIYINMTQTEFV